MLRLFLTVYVVCLSVLSFSQAPDFISVRRKNGRILKTFFAGSPISLETRQGNYFRGPIKAIKNDSVFVTVYDIRTVLTNLGVTVVDTFGTYLTGVPFIEIEKIQITAGRRSIVSRLDKLLMIGGAGYFSLNLLNALFQGQPIAGRENTKKLGIAASAFGVGYLLHRILNIDNHFNTKRHEIIYVHMGTKKNT